MTTTDCVQYNHVPTKKEKKVDLPRSMKPLIPEPLHRVPPQGVTSGISFRSLPEPSLNEIRKICQHYEAKCSGQYNSLGSRYVLELAKEIKSQLDGIETKLEKNNSSFTASRASNTSKKPRKRQGSWLEDILASSTSRLDQNATNRYWEKEDGATEGYVCGPSSLSSSRPQSASCYLSQEIPPEQQIYQLTQMLLQKDSELQFVKDDAIKALETNRKQYNVDLEKEKSNFKSMKEVIEKKHETDLLEVRKEIERVKNDAKLVIDFVRKKANNAIEAERANSEKEKRNVEEKFNEMELKMVEVFNSRLQKAESAIKTFLSQQRFAVKSKDTIPIPVSHFETDVSKDKYAAAQNGISPASTTSDNSTCRDRDSEDSISTRSSINGRDDCFLTNQIRTNSELKKDKHDAETNDEEKIKKAKKNQWFQDRLDELDQWTDALTLAIQQDKIPSPLFYNPTETNTRLLSSPSKTKKPTQKEWRL